MPEEYEDTGENPVLSADDANIPVDIWIYPPDKDSPKWRLNAGNYMPRRATVWAGAYEVEADTRETLAAIVETRILPLYKVAVAQLEAIIAGKTDHLYYWKANEEVVESAPIPEKGA